MEPSSLKGNSYFLDCPWSDPDLLSLYAGVFSVLSTGISGIPTNWEVELDGDSPALGSLLCV